VDGFLVPGHDVKTMAARTLEIVTNPSRREQMGIAARERASTTFCSQKIIPLYEDLYQRILANT
jgi:glycosyltransferase involved in cell wall biosynthesis